MLVEMYTVSGIWYFKDESGMETMAGSIKPTEAKVADKLRLKQIIKLKEAGFTADEILDLIKEI